MATDVRNRRPARKTGPRAAWKTGFYYTRGTPPRPAPRGPRRPPAKKTAPGRGRPSAGDPGRADPGGGPQARRTPGAADPGRADPWRADPRAADPRAADPSAGGPPGGRQIPEGRGGLIPTNLSLETAPLNRVSFRHIQGVGSWPEKQKAAAHDGQLPSK